MTRVRNPIRQETTRVAPGEFDQIPGRKRTKGNRGGFSTIDYVLILAVILPLVTFLFAIAPRIIQLVYEMTIVVIGSPLM